MRLLYIDINGYFQNPTRNLLPALLQCIAKVDFFGPGYLPSEQLKSGLESFYLNNGPYDLVLTNTHFLLSDIYGLDKNSLAYRRSYDIQCKDIDLTSISSTLHELCKINNICALLFENDLYHASEHEIEALSTRSRYIIGLGQDFFLDHEKILAAKSEHFSHLITPHWANFIRDQSHRIANLPAFVGEHEFCWIPLELRPKSWDIPGVGYRARQIASSILTHAGYKIPTRSFLLKAESLALRMGIIKQASRFRQAIINKNFQIRLESAKYIFTCGSEIRMPIRKFFEIPASGALMVCEPFEGFTKAGFKHGENAIISSPENLLDIDADLRSGSIPAQEIASAGRELIWRKHSLHARAEQLGDTFRMIIMGDFAGSGWLDGHYHIRSRNI